ncbi:MAG: HAD family hydrolase [Sulfuricurvum sp.]|uniref:HAD family hydrolase n=1 Tax=Sulfuricurvum sp. TaxID=2025608 RepID=UPI002606497E|nr:HAD family hydrolase [Sulfuricurvum sp.]MDD2828013.1 HAD family hydrolase [Sulfuricurvum sp.]MDD4948110.1 HAD family hydrolase [Sulfuricurvum sp.]
MKKIILFDLDGTLIDSTEAILESFYHSLNTHKEVTDVSDSMITSQIGHTLETMFLGLGVREERVAEHVATYKLYYREIACQKTLMLPNAIEAIEEASEFARLGIVTTKTGVYSRELMEYFGIMKYFEVLIGFEDVTHKKPHPEPILTALEKMKSNTQNVWMIGDTRLDLECSHHAGIDAIGVLSGYDNFEQLSTFDFIIQRDVLEAVRTIAKERIK